MSISEKEFQILTHIKDNPDATLITIIDRFGQAAEIRLQHLLSISAIRFDGHYDDNGVFIETGAYVVTPTGEMLIEDYLLEHRLKQKAKWEDRAWRFVPIIISLIALIKSFSAEIAAIWQMLQSRQ